MRKDYIDWLRNIGILYLFPYHTARVFDDINSFYVKGEPNLFSTILVYTSFWFMPLLFLLAGMSSQFGLRRRTGTLFVKERLSRLLIPFIAGVLIIVPPQAYYAKKFHLNEREGYLEFLFSYFTDLSAWSEYAGGISPAHLWFILFLFLISVATLPIMQVMIRKQYSPAWLHHPIGIVIPFVGLVALSALPDISGKNIFLFAGYFLLGFLLAMSDQIIDTIERYRKAYAAIAMVGTVAILLEHYTIGMKSNVIFIILHGFIYWTALLAMLGYGKKYLNKKSKFMAYFTPAAFPVYILHQTYLVIVSYYVLEATDGGIMAYLLIMLLSFLASMITYELIRRVMPLRFLFGLKP